ncbi:aspartate/glutamate racemase family protein [Streptomyces tanashiensis]|uniref:Aspartate/glutamate racemase family protein n=1 Tax=Streptomyces tanashiensis TaxID=67367 RepID=A0ABY6QVY1_9ACTN|nr:aspartate/glutamate racemase family protein [Streptomyces tanashiensis]UZX20832.1 aspartate/glutamate racemase family protein [Streptomyces tanashiensis]
MVLINPNSSTATTAMMTAIARRALGPALPVRGVTVARGPRMLTDPEALRAAAPEVLAAGLRAAAGGDCAALLVAAFGDPGLTALRAAMAGNGVRGASGVRPASGVYGASGVHRSAGVHGPTGASGATGTPASGIQEVGIPASGTPTPGIPVVGIGEAALLEAAAGGTPFGIATTTPLLADAIHARVNALGLADRYTGLRLTAGAPERLSADPELLLDRLERAVRACAERDGARAVVIGGGPLGEAAEELHARCAVRVVAPIPAACRAITHLLTDRRTGGPTVR